MAPHQFDNNRLIRRNRGTKVHMLYNPEVIPQNDFFYRRRIQKNVFSYHHVIDELIEDNLSLSTIKNKLYPPQDFYYDRGGISILPREILGN